MATTTTHRFLLVASLLACCLHASAETETDKVVLSTETLWRTRTVFEPEEIVLTDGTIRHCKLKLKQNWRKVVTVQDFEPVELPFFRVPAETSADWMAPAFDDSDWARAAGPMLLDDEKRVEWKLLLLRGAFEVTDLTRAAGLKLSVDYKGGIVVYLNGRELTRGHMPKGTLDLYTCAEPDPKEAFLFPNGYLGMREGWRRPFPAWTNMIKARVRHLREVPIPQSMLRKGPNVLAIAIHRAPAPWQYYATRIKAWPYGAADDRSRTKWSRMALHKVELAAPADADVVPNIGRHKTAALAVWNQSVTRKVFTSDYGDPLEPLRPVRISALRNGIFTGQVVVGSDAPMKGLTAKVTNLTGPGVVPASAIQLLYGMPDGHLFRAKRPWFDSLERTPPAEVAVFEEGGRAVLPVWIKITVPADAKAGEYTGTLTLHAAGTEARQVPIAMRVFDWTLPDPAQLSVDMDYFQSPDSVAMQYKVPLWSEKHWRLMERSFELMRPLAARTLYIPCVRRTQLGNEHAMVRWRKGPKGKLTPDLRLAERYLDLAVKHLGKIPAVVLYVWEPSSSGGEYGWRPGRTHDREILITIENADGTLEKAKGPAWGTPECREFWTTLSTAMKAALRKRGLEKSMLFGLLGDHRATQQAMDDITTGSPETKWTVHSHDFASKWMGYEVGYCAAFWGVSCYPTDPSIRRGYGWQNKFWLMYNPRDSMTAETELAKYRTVTESWMGAGQHYPKFTHRFTKEVITSDRTRVRGIGRQGIDFWKVLHGKSRRGRSKWSRTLAGRYPESEWGHLNFARGVPYLTGPGADGAVPTVRYEGLRENLQECEARIFIEKALLDETLKARLGEALAAGAQAVLDERTRTALYLQYTCFNYKVRSWPFFVTGWQRRTEQLFATTAAVAQAVGR